MAKKKKKKNKKRNTAKRVNKNKNTKKTTIPKIKPTLENKSTLKEEKEEKKQKDAKKQSKSKKIWTILIIIFTISLILSGIKIITWYSDNQSQKEQINEIEEKITVKELPAEEVVEEVVSSSENIKEEDDYWKYIKLPYINVDFNELLNINSDTVAYIKVNGTNVNYPVVQTKDNEYYLKHSFNKSINSAGWVFLDYRNDLKNLNANTIIYAHGRVNNTMFGSLKNIFKSSWYENTDNYIIHLSTLTENTIWQIFSAYIIDDETYYLTSDFGSNEQYQEFLDTMIGRSELNFNTTVDTNDKILTLSTCYGHTERLVVQAKLIKKSNKVTD